MTAPAVVMLSGSKFLFACTAIALVLLILGRQTALPAGLLAAEVFATILGLFLFGSFRFQIHKNALTYGMLLIIIATFCGLPSSDWHSEINKNGWGAWVADNLLSFHGLDELIHADTMLFILGLTFFVSVIAQTRLLEGLTFFLLHRFRGAVLPTVISVTAVVAFASGILDGVSMIGLTIRTLVIIMLLAAAPIAVVRYAVMVCTTVTTVCGIWLAYGEPPNLIMKANLYPHIDNAFFLRYCAPAAVACYLVIAWNLRKKLRGEQIELDELDVIDANAEDVRFLQAMRHGKVSTTLELSKITRTSWATRRMSCAQRLREGESLGVALIRRGRSRSVAQATARSLCQRRIGRNTGPPLFARRRRRPPGRVRSRDSSRRRDRAPPARASPSGAEDSARLALVPFIGMLIWHGIDHSVPLFLASFAGFGVALLGIVKLSRKSRTGTARGET